ncbi:MAG TPA: hypothetical protein VHQ86_00010 [Candidatus Saccharimonadia bacterium]|nr:hypothetical protein [Candidatus Saccharimonadia bacterium]
MAAVFGGPPDVEELALADEATIEVWNAWVRWKLTQPFAAGEWSKRARSVGFEDEEVKKVLELVAEVENEPRYLELLRGMHLALNFTLGIRI